MAFRDFTLEDVGRKLGITTAPAVLFPNLQPVPPPQWLLDGFARHTILSRATEQARRESIIAPTLDAARTVSGGKLAIFSAPTSNVDASRGLNGAGRVRGGGRPPPQLNPSRTRERRSSTITVAHASGSERFLTKTVAHASGSDRPFTPRPSCRCPTR